MLRTLASIVLSVIVVFVLFWIMHLLILGNTNVQKKDVETKAIEMVRLKRDTTPETKTREKPEPPPPPKEPPPPPKLKVQSDTPQQNVQPQMDMPNIDLSTAMGSGPFMGQMGQGGAGLGTGMFDGDIIPIARIAPQYPRQAARDGIEGYVVLEIVVNPDGTVRSADVKEAKPRGLFDAAAVRAVMSWKFKPKVVNGQPVAQRGVQKIQFSLNGGQ